MTSEEFSEVYWYSGMQEVFVTVFQTSVDHLCKKKIIQEQFLFRYFDCFLSNHTVGCCNINSIKEGKVLFWKQCLYIFVVLFCSCLDATFSQLFTLRTPDFLI